MVLNYNLTLSNDTIAMYVCASTSHTPAINRSQTLMRHFFSRVWISSADAAAVAAKGYRFVHAASNSFYLVRLIEPLSYST